MTDREDRKTALKQIGAGLGLTGAAAATQEHVGRKVGVESLPKAAKEVYRTRKFTSKHGKFLGAWMGTRGAAAAGIPLAAVGAHTLATRKPAQGFDVKHDVVGESVKRTLLVPEKETGTREEKRGKRVATGAELAATGGGGALGALGAKRLLKNKSAIAIGAGTALGSAGGLLVAKPVTQRAAKKASRGKYTYEIEKGLPSVYRRGTKRMVEGRLRSPEIALSRADDMDPKLKNAVFRRLEMHREGRRTAGRIANARQVGHADFRSDPLGFEQRHIRRGQVYTREIPWRKNTSGWVDKVAKFSGPHDAAINELAQREQKQLIRRKKKASTYALTSAGLGVTALGLRSPQLVRVVGARIPKARSSRVVGTAARLEPSMTNASNTVGVVSLGTGSAGSLNFARIQRSETKADERSSRALNKKPVQKAESPELKAIRDRERASHRAMPRFVRQKIELDAKRARAHRIPEGKVKMKVQRRGDLHEVDAHLKGKNVGYLEVRPDGVVNHIKVKDEYRRKGIATAMWQNAEKAGLNPQHNPSAQSPSGAAWAKSRAVRKDDRPLHYEHASHAEVAKAMIRIKPVRWRGMRSSGLRRIGSRVVTVRGSLG